MVIGLSSSMAPVTQYQDPGSSMSCVRVVVVGALAKALHQVQNVEVASRSLLQCAGLRGMTASRLSKLSYR